MSNRNDPQDAAAMAIFAVLAMIGIFLFFVAALFSLALTVVCIFAWNKERTIFGQTITPTEARAFITAGFIGAIVFGLFGEFLYHADLLLESNRGGLGPVGYVVGSLGWGAWYGKQQEEKERLARESQALERFTAPPPRPQTEWREEPQRQYEFASWDDEERRG